MGKNKYVCESGLRWIMNYRYLCGSFRLHGDGLYIKSLRKLIVLDNHSDESLIWTIKQSKNIDKLGWKKWMNNTKGPSGFQ